MWSEVHAPASHKGLKCTHLWGRVVLAPLASQLPELLPQPQLETWQTSPPLSIEEKNVVVLETVVVMTLLAASCTASVLVKSARRVVRGANVCHLASS